MKNFDKVIYISHPFGGFKKNKYNIEQIIVRLLKKYPNYMFISAVHAFGFLYDEVDYDTGMAYCLKLLDISDEMWLYGDYKDCKGCIIEVQYCIDNNILYKEGSE